MGKSNVEYNCVICDRALVQDGGGYWNCPDTSDEHDERYYLHTHGDHSTCAPESCPGANRG